MDPASAVYLILFLIGLGFAIVSFILSGLGHFGTGHDADVCGHNVDVGGHDVGVHADGSSCGIHLSPVSPITIAMFITSFGGIGFILEQFPSGTLLLSLPLALVSGFVIAGAAFYILYRIFSATQASSSYTRESVLDLEAEVITSIPANGVGEIAYVAKGSRFSAPARSEDQEAIPKHAIVRMTRVAGNIFYVREIPDEKLLRAFAELEEIDNSGK
jgi:membrane protein implicated in regulation of membrane protease activity